MAGVGVCAWAVAGAWGVCMGWGGCLGCVHGLFRGSGGCAWTGPMSVCPAAPPRLRLSPLLSLNTKMKPTEIHSATCFKEMDVKWHLQWQWLYIWTPAPSSAQEEQE